MEILKLLIAIIDVCVVCNAASDRLGLKVVKHAPCRSSGSWQPHIEFGNSRTAPLVADRDEIGCYSMAGDVNVHRPIRDNLQIYAEVRMTPDPDAPPEKCSNFDDRTGCGGFGSCAYCEDCQSLGARKETELARIRLTKGGKPLDCDGKTLQPGVYKDIHISFCMPTEQDFLRSSSFDKETWKAIRATQGDKVPLFLNVYVFKATDGIARAVKRQQQVIEQRMRQRDAQLDSKYRWSTLLTAAEDRPPPPLLGLPLKLEKSDYDRLPIGQLVNRDRHIACHKIFANLYFDAANAPINRINRSRSVDATNVFDNRG